MKYYDILKELKHLESEAATSLKITTISNVNLSPYLDIYLRWYSVQAGFRTDVSLLSYDDFLQNTSYSLFEVNYVIILLNLESLVPDQALYVGQSSEKADVLSLFTYLLSDIRSRTRATLICFGLEAPVYPVSGILGYQEEENYSVHVLNAHLRKTIQQMENTWYIETNQLLMRIGYDNFYDAKNWLRWGSPYSEQASSHFASEIFKFIRVQKGLVKKCLVLDCDNVLWGGVIGEDGLSGVLLGGEHIGRAYQEFQREILGFYKRGVILALCSKNNPEDVLNMFREHPEMVLQEEHISYWAIGWKDKMDSLKEIANGLGLGLDSLLFIDDSLFEVEAIRSLLPEVEVIHLPEGKVGRYCNLLRTSGWFDTLSSTEEDQKRMETYKTNAQREQLKRHFSTFEEYLEALEVNTQIFIPGEIDFPRLAQLTQRTNQFNLTASRYSEADITAFARKSGYILYCVRVQDRFGDLGTVGAMVLQVEMQKKELSIEAFVLSCRALGRRIEHVMLERVRKEAKQLGLEKICCMYRSTGKNQHVKVFLQEQGFFEVDGYYISH